MKEFIFKQYLEVRRVIAVKVPDDYSEKTAAELLDHMPLDNNKLPSSVRIVERWKPIMETGIETEDGRVLLHDDDGEAVDCG